MTILSISQAQSYAAQAGFSGVAKDIIVAIAQAESSLNTIATNKNPGGSTDRGVLQINNYYHSEVSDACAFDPICSFKEAFKISNNGSSFTPWTTFTNGAYKKYMGGASTSNFRWPDWLTQVNQFYNPAHRAIDVNAPYHSPVPALWGGTVVEAGRTQWSSDPNDTSGGIITILANIPGLGQRTYSMLHMDTIADGLKVGSQVVAGQLLGLSGGQLSGGQWPAAPRYSSGPHMHIEITGGTTTFGNRVGSASVDPLPYVKAAVSSIPTGVPEASMDNSKQLSFDPISGVAEAIQNLPGNIIQSIAESDLVQRGFLIFVGLIFVIIGVVILFMGNGGMNLVKV